MMHRWPSWTDSLACCAYLRDMAREAEATVPVAPILVPAALVLHWQAFNTLTVTCRRFLSRVEEESRARR